METTSNPDTTMEASAPSLAKSPSPSRRTHRRGACFSSASNPGPSIWGCPPGKFQLKFEARLTCYFLKGRVKASVMGSGKCVEFGAGDLVVFPKGLRCTWDVVVGIDMHYNFDAS
ncbi:hypothetical protein ABZP36_004176 [Zizania latifolia]